MTDSQKQKVKTHVCKLHPLNVGRCGFHFTFLGCKLKMMGCYIQILNYCKGLQSGQIAPQAGLFGEGSVVIWPIFFYFELGNRAVTFGNWLGGAERGKDVQGISHQNPSGIRISHLAHFLHNPVGVQLLTLYNYMTNIDSNDVRKIAKLVNIQRFDILSFSRANKIYKQNKIRGQTKYIFCLPSKKFCYFSYILTIKCSTVFIGCAQALPKRYKVTPMVENVHTLLHQHAYML